MTSIETLTSQIEPHTPIVIFDLSTPESAKPGIPLEKPQKRSAPEVPNPALPTRVDPMPTPVPMEPMRTPQPTVPVTK